MRVFAAEEIILQCNVLSYRIDAYFLKYKLAIEIDEQGHNDRSIDYKIERQKSIEKELDCKSIRIDPSEEGFDVNIELGRIQNYIIKWTKSESKKSLIDKISNKLLRLEFKSNNPINTKWLKYIVKNILPTI